MSILYNIGRQQRCIPRGVRTAPIEGQHFAREDRLTGQWIPCEHTRLFQWKHTRRYDRSPLSSFFWSTRSPSHAYLMNPSQAHCGKICKRTTRAWKQHIAKDRERHSVRRSDTAVENWARIDSCSSRTPELNGLPIWRIWSVQQVFLQWIPC